MPELVCSPKLPAPRPRRCPLHRLHSYAPSRLALSSGGGGGGGIGATGGGKRAVSALILILTLALSPALTLTIALTPRRFYGAFGRRPLLLASAAGCAAGHLCVAAAFATGRDALAVGGVLLFIAAVSIGLGSMSWVYAAEVSGPQSHARACGKERGGGERESQGGGTKQTEIR